MKYGKITFLNIIRFYCTNSNNMWNKLLQFNSKNVIDPKGKLLKFAIHLRFSQKLPNSELLKLFIGAKCSAAKLWLYLKLSYYKYIFATSDSLAIKIT